MTGTVLFGTDDQAFGQHLDIEIDKGDAGDDWDPSSPRPSRKVLQERLTFRTQPISNKVGRLKSSEIMSGVIGAKVQRPIDFCLVAHSQALELSNH